MTAVAAVSSAAIGGGGAAAAWPKGDDVPSVAISATATNATVEKISYRMSQVNLSAASGATCCWSAWGGTSTCGKYPKNAAGGRCNTAWAKHCTSDQDCPLHPVHPPPPP